jgi:DNA-binding LacI/PurR family transcriptional regulator
VSVERAVRLQDIADRAGVSRATVSTALSGRGRLSDATRHRIRDLARELGYEVNIGARNLRKSRTGSIGLYLPDLTSSLAYYMDFAFGAVEAAHMGHLSLTLIPPRGPLEAMPHVDGFLVVDVSDADPVASSILSGRRPVVSGELVPSSLPQPTASVFVNHRAATRRLLDHMRDSGGRNFAVLAPPADTQWGQEVRQSCEDWSRAARIPLRLIDTDFAPGAERAGSDTEVALRDNTVDAVVAIPDGSALIAMSVAQRLGRRVGQDLLLASYVDNTLHQHAEPPITAVDLAPRAFGRRCANLLMRLIDPNESELPKTETFEIELRKRASSVFRL